MLLKNKEITGVFFMHGKVHCLWIQFKQKQKFMLELLLSEKISSIFHGWFSTTNFKIGASILRALFYGKCPFLLVSDAALIFQIRLWRYIFLTCYMTSSWSHDQRVMWLYLGACHGMSPPCQVWWI